MSNATVVVALISAVAAVAGSIFTWMGRNQDSSDKRIDSVINANQDLVTAYKDRESVLLDRLTSLEVSRDELQREVSKLRDQVSTQAVEMYALRAHDAEMRQWAGEILAWADKAMRLIFSLQGSIEEPPGPPKPYLG